MSERLPAVVADLTRGRGFRHLGGGGGARCVFAHEAAARTRVRPSSAVRLRGIGRGGDTAAHAARGSERVRAFPVAGRS